MSISQQHCQILALRVGKLLVRDNHLLSIAESCTGGWFAKCCTDCVGSSKWFDCSIVSYSYASKQRLLHIDPVLIEKYGAVDERIVTSMATSMLSLTEATYSVAISGIAGPQQESSDHAKPVGMVCFAWAKKRKPKQDKTPMIWVNTQYFQGSREQVRLQSVHHALQELEKILLCKD